LRNVGEISIRLRIVRKDSDRVTIQLPHSSHCEEEKKNAEKYDRVSIQTAQRRGQSADSTVQSAQSTQRRVQNALRTLHVQRRKTKNEERNWSVERMRETL
jgi:hypothetical protein